MNETTSGPTHERPMTLLERAKQATTPSGIGAAIAVQEFELLLAWLKDEINSRQAAIALNMPKQTGNIPNKMGVLAKKAYKAGLLKTGG